MARVLNRRKLIAPWPSQDASGRLGAELDAAIQAGRHAIVHGTPGSGLSDRVAAWARERRALWLELDGDDADLGSFTDHLVGAYTSGIEGFETEAYSLTDWTSDPVAARAAVAALLADLGEHSARVPLVVDRYPLARSAESDALIGLLLERLPTTAPLVLLLPEDDAWIGIASAAGRPAVLLGPDVHGAEPGPERDLPPLATGRTRELLTLMAPLETFDDRLCEEALDWPLPPDRRDQLLAQGHLLRRDETAYRLHPRTSAELRVDCAAAAMDPDFKLSLRRLGDYLWRSGRAIGALSYWVATGQRAWAIERLLYACEDWLKSGKIELLATGIALVGDHGRPELLAAEAEGHRRRNRLEPARTGFEAALRMFGAAGDEVGAASCALGLAEIALCTGDARAAQALVEAHRASAVGAEPLGAKLAMLEGRLALADARGAAGALEAFERAWSLSLTEDLRLQVEAAVQLGALCLVAGKPDQAVATLTTTLQGFGVPGDPRLSIALARAFVALDSPLEARRAAEEGLSMARLLGLADQEALALEELARAQGLAGDADGARRTVRQAARLSGREVALPEIRASGTVELPPLELCVLCLGGFSGWLGGTQPIAGALWQGAESKLLLVYLLHHDEATLDDLTAALTGPRSQVVPGASLAIARLRRALEPSRSPFRASRFILRRDGVYAFNRQVQLEVDTWRFEATLAPRAGETPAQEAERLQAGLALYNGPFLPECRLAWAVQLREHFARLEAQARARLTELGVESEPAR